MVSVFNGDFVGGGARLEQRDWLGFKVEKRIKVRYGVIEKKDCMFIPHLTTTH